MYFEYEIHKEKYVGGLFNRQVNEGICIEYNERQVTWH